MTGIEWGPPRPRPPREPLRAQRWPEEKDPLYQRWPCCPCGYSPKETAFRWKLGRRVWDHVRRQHPRVFARLRSVGVRQPASFARAVYLLESMWEFREMRRLA